VPEALSDTKSLQNLWNDGEAARFADRWISCGTDRICSGAICALPTSAAATPARSSSFRIR
jgi:hypothetical protein